MCLPENSPDVLQIAKFIYIYPLIQNIGFKM